MLHDLQVLTVDGERLWQSLMDMAKIGATPKGGVRRVALTLEDKAGRDQFVSWCKALGLAVTVDRIGNIFARREGSDPALPPVVSGSHLDTQPSGGRFDGCYGVMAALEVCRTLNDHGITTRHPIEIAVWTNEEGTRFTPVMMGRVIAADGEISGCPVQAGQRLLLSFGSANRDPAVFADADEVRIDRMDNRHLAFGVGVHRCLGSNLARLELRIALERWLARFPRFEPNGEPVWTIGVRGPTTVPLRLLDGAAACE